MTEAAPLPPGWPVMSREDAHALLTAPGVKFEMEDKVIQGRTVRTWKNAPPTFRRLFEIGLTYPDREFVIYENERATYPAFGKATLTLAHELIARGVKKGDRVALIMRNLPEWPVVFFASLITGAIITPMNAWWTGPELHYGLTDSGARIAIVDSERLERISEHIDRCPDLELVYVSRHDEEIAHPKVRRLEEVIGQVSDWAALADLALPDIALEPEDPATIFYTSGTTGKPKGAMASHRAGCANIGSSGIANARSLLMAGEPLPNPDPHLEPQKSSLLVVPLFHVTGCFAVLGPIVATGGKLVLIRKWEPEQAMRIIEREKVNATGGVPTIAWQLIEHPARSKYDLSSLETVSYGGAPSAPELVRQIKETFKGSRPGNGWGMTETCATFTSHIGWEYVAKPASCGPAIPVGEIKIMTLDGHGPLPAGEVGELWVYGPNVVHEYWNKPEATAQTFVDGWLKTGDLARIDDDGYLFMIDRAKDMLIRGGENIYCIEVENVLYDHPAVMDAALVGIAHRTLGEEPAAVVTLKPGATATERELRAFVAERLAAFKVPVKVLFHTETLPRNANGKIMKNDLKKLFETTAA